MAGQRYIPNIKPGEPLHTVPDPHAELVACLTRITRECAPSNPWKDHFRNQPRGLFSGPTSIAYLFLFLSRSHPDLKVGHRSPREWCAEYLNCGSDELSGPSGLGGWGITNEYLSHNAVKAAATQDPKYIDRLESALAPDRFECPAGDNELFFGRAGTLVLLRLVQHWVPSSRARMAACMQPLTAHILASAPWQWHGKSYTGAVHGVIGILTQLVLSDPALGHNPVVERWLSEQLALQAEDGYWPPKAVNSHERRSAASDLVQFCHGAPGFVISLARIRPHVSRGLQDRIEVAVRRGRREIWNRGLLRKEPNLCHGIMGNMLALDDWAQREHFMSYATLHEIRRGLDSGRFLRGDDPNGLLWGDAGRAWGWMVMDARLDLGFPGYTDV